MREEMSRGGVKEGSRHGAVTRRWPGSVLRTGRTKGVPAFAGTTGRSAQSGRVVRDGLDLGVGQARRDLRHRDVVLPGPGLEREELRLVVVTPLARETR